LTIGLNYERAFELEANQNCEIVNKFSTVTLKNEAGRSTGLPGDDAVSAVVLH
jgi:hypothetical protein